MNSVKHVRIPRIEDSETLQLGDLFIYAVIKNAAYPIEGCTSQFPDLRSRIKLSTLLERIKCSMTCLLDSIERLERVGLLTIKEWNQKCKEYIFKYSDTKVDLFSEEFIQDPNFSHKEKDFWIQLQRYVWIDRRNRTATLNMSVLELSKKMNKCERTVKKYLNIFKDANVLIPSNDGFIVDLDIIHQTWLYDKKETSNNATKEESCLLEKIDSLEKNMNFFFECVSRISDVQDKIIGLLEKY